MGKVVMKREKLDRRAKVPFFNPEMPKREASEEPAEAAAPESSEKSAAVEEKPLKKASDAPPPAKASTDASPKADEESKEPSDAAKEALDASPAEASSEGAPESEAKTAKRVTSLIPKKTRTKQKRQRRTPASRLPTQANAAPSSRIANLLEAAESLSTDKLYPSEQDLAMMKSHRAKKALTAWYARVRDLVDYKEKNGDTCVPQKYPDNKALGIWVNKQRMEYKRYHQGEKNSLNVEKIAILNGVGFSWGKSKGEVSWNERYGQLLQYHAEKGHCKVPTKGRDNPGLGRWVTTQRNQYKKWKDGDKDTSMTEGRAKRLDDLGFTWSAQK